VDEFVKMKSEDKPLFEIIDWGVFYKRRSGSCASEVARIMALSFPRAAPGTSSKPLRSFWGDLLPS